MAGNYRLGHRPALDAVRGLAVLMVVVSHSLWEHPGSGGAVGVTLFFVLSGFLITRLLIEEKDRTGTISLSEFWLRRVSRLLPAFALLLATMACAGLPFSVLAVPALYLADIPQVVALVAPTGLPYIGHTWTLSMEEQFYVVWPAFFLLVMRRRIVLGLLSLTLLALVLWRAWIMAEGSTNDQIVIGTYLRADALILGCCLAFVIARFPRSPMMLALSAGLLLATAVPTGMSESMFGLTVAAAGSALLVGWAATTTTDVQGRALQGLGRISYGIYLWHYPVALIIAPSLPWWAAAPLVLAVSVCIAVLSWRLIEMPARRAILAKFSRRQPGRPSTGSDRPDPGQGEEPVRDHV